MLNRKFTTFNSRTNHSRDVVQHMKKLTSIIILLIFGLSYGQNETELNDKKLIVRSTHWVTEKCSDLNNQYENDLCVRKEINNFVIKNLKWSIEDNLSNGDYEIRIHLTIEEDGGISKVLAKSEYSKLNNELEKTLMLFQNRVKLVDQNGKAHKNTLSFPLKFSVE